MRFTSTHDIKTVRRQMRLEQYAWQNRQVMTKSEAALWAALRGHQLGVQFRRQMPLCGRYIVDFCAPAAWLVVEVDGGYHARRGRADARRDRDLARVGYRVIRLPAELVLNNLGTALERVVQALR